MKKIIFSMMLALILTSILTIAFSIQPVKTTDGTIYIRADGSIDPPTAPIQRDGNLYTFTANIYDSIVVKRDNIIIDGAGHTLQGTGSGNGIDLTGRTNVTIRNTQIKNFDNGIWLYFYSDYNIISGNNIINNNHGVWLGYSSNNIIIGNNITANSWEGVYFYYSFNNNVSRNNITNNSFGLYLYSSFNNNISRNNITANTGYGILLDYSSNNNVISGNNITANFWFGIYLRSSSDYNIISGNNIINNNHGIFFDSSSNNSVSGNNITNNYRGVWLDSSSTYNSIGGNDIANNSGGVWVYSSSDYNIISGNNIINNGDGVWLDSSSNNILCGNMFTNCGLIVCGSYWNVVENNTVNGKPLIYLEGVIDYRIGDAGQVILVNCDGIRVENLNLSHTCIGIELWQTNNCVVIRNNITANSWDGVLLYHSSDYNIISENNIINNYFGVRLYSSSNNLFYHNNFIDNSVQVYSDESINVWDDGYPSGGNYWSDYTGVDADGDGIGDAPYIIDANNRDRYPLMKPWTPIHDVAIINIAFSKQCPSINETTYIYVTIENRGNLIETFNVSVNYTRIFDPLIGTQTVTLHPGGIVMLNFTWTPNASGRYEIKAYTSLIPEDINPQDNTKTVYIYVSITYISGSSTNQNESEEVIARGGRLRYIAYTL